MAIALQGQSVISIAAMQYGTIESFPDVLIDNNLDLENDLEIGQVVEIKTASYKSFRSLLETALIADEEGEYEHVVTDGQSLLDVAAQVGGTIDMAIDLLIDNPNAVVFLHGAIKAGTRLKVNRKHEVRPELVKYFSDRNRRINNRNANDKLALGIGYMGIEFTLIVG